MNSQEIERRRAIMPFKAAAKKRPRFGSDCIRRGAITRARIPNPIIINPHCVKKAMNWRAMAR